MKGEDQVSEVLAEGRRWQDQAQAKRQRTTEAMHDVRQEVQGLQVQVGTVLEKQHGHQQALRPLTINQRKSRNDLQNIVGILD